VFNCVRVIEEFNLDLGLLLLRQASIEKRLKGVRLLKRPLESVTAKEKKGFSIASFARRALNGAPDAVNATGGGGGDDAQRDYKKPVPADKLVEYYLRTNVVGLLVALVDYPELIRQGVDIAAFVADRAPAQFR
jgi:hypothetical protein